MAIYKDITKTIHERAQDLLERMTVQEKMGQVNQKMYGWNAYEKKSDDEFEITREFKDYVEFGNGVGALYGLHRADPWSGKNHNVGAHERYSKIVTNMVQRYVVENSRLGIPALIVEECPHGHQALNSTSYPTNITKASSFDSDLIEKNAQAMAKELSRKGVHIALVSTLDLARDPRWGRSEETFGENSYLAKEYTKATIRGFQKDLVKEDEDFRNKTVTEINKSSDQIGVVLKHFIAQGDALGGHNGGSVNMGDREFHDTYYELIKSCSTALGVMAAYNDIDGVPCHINGDLFNDRLRDDHNYKGLVMADGVALERILGLYDSREEAANAALTAGIDLSLWDDVYTHIESGINSNEITMETLDKAVYNVLCVKLAMGLFEEDFSDDSILESESLRQEWADLNLEIAEKSAVLVKNDGILPFNKNFNGKIAVIGPNTDNLINQLGDYTPYQDHEYSSTLLQGVRKVYKNADVQYELGCEIRDLKVNRINEAVKLAQSSDVIILGIGGSSARNFDMEFMNNGALSSKGHNMDTGENVDLHSLALGGHQLKLLDELSKLDKPIITVLIHGRAIELETIMEKSNAVVSAWYPGQMGGLAIANTLSGLNRPVGRMPVTFPINASVLPLYSNMRSIGREMSYYDINKLKTLEFGFGLNYDKVKLESISSEKVKYSIQDIKNGETISIECKFKNQESHPVEYSTLMFMQRDDINIVPLEKELKGFKKIYFKGDEEKTITFELSLDDLQTYNLDRNIDLIKQEITLYIEDLDMKINIS